MTFLILTIAKESGYRNKNKPRTNDDGGFGTGFVESGGVRRRFIKFIKL